MSPTSRWTQLRREPERGGGRGSLSWVILIPVALLLVFGTVQAGVYFYARQLALQAAQTGVQSGRLEPVSPGRAEQRAQQFLGQAAGDWLSEVTVSANGGDVIRVTVTGQSLSLVPGVTFSVDQTAAGSAEIPAP